MNRLQTLAELYTLLVEKKWKGSIQETGGGGDSLTQASSLEIKELYHKFADLNLQVGDRVIVVSDLSIKTIATYLCLWHLGAVIIPLKAPVDWSKLLPVAKDANARFVINPSTEEMSELTTYQPKPQSFIYKSKRRVCGTDLALIIYTSGSTGEPKGIMLTHTNVVIAISGISEYLQLKEDETILCLLPLSFDYGMYQVFFSFSTNCKLFLFNQQLNPLLIIKAVKQHSISCLPVVPSIASSLEKILQVTHDTLPSLKKITNTGGALNESVILGLKAALPHLHIYAMYGLTESKRVCYLPPEDENKIGSVGIPMPGLEAKIFKILKNGEETLYEETEPFEEGVLFVRGPSVMQGYTKESSEGTYIVKGNYRDDNWLCTNDLFYRDEEGYLYFKGREKDLIKQGGFCLYPKELENLINKHPHVVLTAIFGDKDALGDEIAHCALQLKESNDPTKERENVLQWIESTLDPDYRPRKISFIEEMPLNENGKVDKKKLKQIFL